MQDYLQLMATTMELKGLAKNTQKYYLAHIRHFTVFCDKNPMAAGYDDVRAFLHHAITQRKLSSSYVNSFYSARNGITILASLRQADKDPHIGPADIGNQKMSSFADTEAGGNLSPQNPAT